MTRDFTLRQYRLLVDALGAAGYRFVTCERYFAARIAGEPLPERFVLLRHDVDKRANNAVVMSRIESSQGIQATYYFGVTSGGNVPEAIRAVAAGGHEIGYHYEDLVLTRGDVPRAGAHFADALAYFRRFYPVRTICMHGSPRSAIDPRTLWKYVSYRAYGIIGEPYLDADFSDLFYLTDTGRRWDGWRVSARDKIPERQEQWEREGLVFRHTSGIIRGAESGALPPRLMITTHPQRWTDSLPGWCAELVSQNMKNVVKYWMLHS